MGIKGLDKYIEIYTPQVLVPVDIAACAKAYAQKHNRDPVLLIMVSPLLRALKEIRYHDISHLHMVDKLGSHILQLIKRYSEHNIHSILLFGNSPIYKSENWIQDKTNDTVTYTSILRSLESKEPQKAYKELITIAANQELIKVVLRGTHCEIRQLTEGSDSEMKQLLSNSEYFGILAQDTDYIIMEGVGHYFSAQYLDDSGLLTKEYCRQELASSLGIEERLLPLLGSLCGNSRVYNKELHKFHVSLLCNHPNIKRLKLKKFLPGHFLIPSVAKWITRRADEFRDSKLNAKRVSELMKFPGLENDMFKSFCYYGVFDVQPESTVKEAVLGDWSQILHLANERHVKGAHVEIRTVLKYSKHFLTHSREIITDRNYPNQSVVTEELLKRMYGVLLKERPLSLETPRVNLYHHKKNEYSPTEIVPIYPSNHPGLKYLWGTCPIEEKLPLLWWVVTGKSVQGSMTSLMSIPGDLRISTLALFFLANVAEYKLLRWQIEALIGQVVCLFLRNDLTHYEMSPLSALERHISTVYLSVCNSIVMADDVCGSPLFGKNFVFDGVLFNKLFNLMKNGFTDSEVCKTHHFKILLGLIYPS